MKTIFTSRLFWWITAFGIAMAFLESAVVIYARALYFPQGFAFPLAANVPSYLAVTEIGREAATIVMLLAVGWFAGKNFMQRFAWFILSFAIWDLFYYVFLKLVLNWPASIMDWDVLFLIPTTWVGPVLSPLIISCNMIIVALLILRFSQGIENPTMTKSQWWWLISGCLVIIVSFTYDFTFYLMDHYAEIPGESTFTVLSGLSSSYVPISFNWWIFALGEVCILVATWQYFQRYKALLVSSTKLSPTTA